MADRYLSATGSDTNLGTEDSPWATFEKAYAAMGTGELSRGDCLYVERGSWFYQRIHTPTLQGTGKLIIAPYGDKRMARPIFSGAKIAVEAEWDDQGSNVWRLDISNAAYGVSYTGYLHDGTDAKACDVGAIIDEDGVIHGQKRWTQGALANTWDFYSDKAQYLYVKHVGNPGVLRITVSQVGVAGLGNVTLTGMDIREWGDHGVSLGITSNVVIEDCRIGIVGGVEHTTQSRRGNGIQNYPGCWGIKILKNEIYETYDSGYTAQGDIPDGSNKYWRDITVAGNKIHHCGQSIEFWTGGGYSVDPDDPTAGIINCKVYNNHSWAAGRSWASEVRPDRDGIYAGRGVHVLMYKSDLQGDIEMYNNVFEGARDGYMFKSAYGVLPNGFRAHHNSVTLREGQFLLYAWPTRPGGMSDSDYQDLIDTEMASWATVQNAPDYQAEYGIEEGSTFNPVPDDPADVDRSYTALVGSRVEALAKLAAPQPADSQSLMDMIADLRKRLPPRPSRTAVNDSGGTRYCKLATIDINNQYGTAAGVLSFISTGEAPASSRAAGEIIFNCWGKGGGTDGTGGVYIEGNLPVLATSGAFAVASFQMIRTVNDTTNNIYQYEIWVNMTDANASLAITPLNVALTAASFWMHPTPGTATAVSSGTSFAATQNPRRPVQLTAAPAIAPTYVGQPASDTTNDKHYVGSGTSSSSDFNILN